MFGQHAPGQSYFGQAGRGVTSFLQSLTGSIVPAGVLQSSFLIFVVLSSAVASSATALKQTHRSVVGAVSWATRVLLGQTYFGQFVLGQMGTTTASLTVLSKQVSRTLTGAVTPTTSFISTLVRVFSQALTSVVTFGYESIVGQLYFGQAVLGRYGSSAAEGGRLVKSTLRAINTSLTPTAALVGVRVTFFAVAGAVGSSGAFSKMIMRYVSGGVTPFATAAKLLWLRLAGFVNALGVLTRTNPAEVKVYIDGVLALGVQYNTLEIEDTLNEIPNQCNLEIRTNTRPVEGQTLEVRTTDQSREFYGTILLVRQLTNELPENILYSVTAQDMTWKFNRRLVTKKWTNVSATQIGQEIVSGFTTGFTSTNIVAGLPTLAYFECIRETPSAAFDKLRKEIGGNYYVDYYGDVHLFITEAVDSPDTLTPTAKFADFVHTGDITQIRTRIKAIGVGVPSVEQMLPSHTLVTVPDSTIFEVGGGQFAANTDIGTYTGKHGGGVTTAVDSSVAAPSVAPTAAIRSGVVGNVIGPKRYKVAFANSQGETSPSNASNSVTGVAFTPPTAGSVAATSGVIGKLFGVYIYVITYTTSLGKTTVGTSFGRTATAVAAPGALTVAAGTTIGKLIGARSYRVTFKTPYGETEGGTVTSRTAAATTTPSAPSITVVDTGLNTDMGKLIGAYGYKVALGSVYGQSAASSAGSRTAVAQVAPVAPSSISAVTPGPLLGAYGWKVAFVGPDGKETLGSVGSLTVSSPTADTPSLSSSGGATISFRISYVHPVYGETAWSSAATDTSSGGTVTVTFAGLSGCDCKIYSTGSGHPSTDPYYLVAVIPAGTTSYTHSTASGSEGFSPQATLGKYATMTIPTGPVGTIARRIYRTRPGGSDYFLAGEVGNNTTTTWNDVTPDGALTLGAPLQNLNGEQHTISGIGTGPTGTTYRDIYRTEAGGSIYYFLKRLPDNSTTSFVDNAPDSELNKAVTAPSTATMGDQHALTNIQLGPTGTLSRVVYCTDLGGTIYKKLIEIGDNTTTVFTDNYTNEELGQDVAPTVSTAGGQSHTLTVPTGPTGTLARDIWRTTAGGSSFQFVGQLTNNVATSFVDNVADTALGDYVPLVNTAGASQIDVTGIPTGGSGITDVIIYREALDGTFKFLDSVTNGTSSYIDNKDETELGRVALSVGTLGADIGGTSLALLSVVGLPTLGWVTDGNQNIYYTSISGNTLTGIPASVTISSLVRSGTTATAITSASHGFVTGQIVTVYDVAQTAYNGAVEITVTGLTTFTFTVASSPTTPATSASTMKVAPAGAILAAIAGGAPITSVPFLSGVSGVVNNLPSSTSIQLYVERNDAAAQAALAALEGGDGIHESEIQVSDAKTLAVLTTAADAELNAYKTKTRSIHIESRDRKLRSGKTLTSAMTAPTDQSGEFLIQRVITTQYNIAFGVFPLRKVDAAPLRISWQDILKRIAPPL